MLLPVRRPRGSDRDYVKNQLDGRLSLFWRAAEKAGIKQEDIETLKDIHNTAIVIPDDDSPSE